MVDLKDKKVTIIGAARSGVAAAGVVLKLGGVAKISEMQSMGGHDMVDRRVIMEVGGHTRDFVEDSDYVILSPGVRPDALPVVWAREKGIEVMGETEFAFRLCPSPVVAVTGSNGKTTTSTLIAEILQRAGHHVCFCGNMGRAFSSCVLDLAPQDIVVLEISSFQLESTIHFKPHVAVWTNFSQNHLDRHKDVEEYFQAKRKIFAHQDSGDFAVLNFDQPQHRQLANTLKAKVLFFNGPTRFARSPWELALDNPNYLAAMTVARALRVNDEVCLRTFAEFKGVAHRLEFVRHFKGVDFINDSKSTTVESGRWALERSLKPLVMICGGLDKHLDYAPLRPLVGKKVKHMIAIGQAREIMKATFGDVVPVETAASLEEAVIQAKSKALDGECVVFSPMCASFDMFRDYEHRGEVFKEIVNHLS